MNIPTTLDVLQLSKNDTIWNRFRNVYRVIVRVINGNIEFGNPTSGPANISGNWITITTPVAPNTDFTVTHNLNRVAVGYLIMTKDMACDIYTSPTANAAPKTTLILRATAASAHLTIFVL